MLAKRYVVAKNRKGTSFEKTTRKKLHGAKKIQRRAPLVSIYFCKHNNPGTAQVGALKNTEHAKGQYC